MSGQATILSKIFTLTRGDLEDASFASPRLGELLDQMEMVRLTRLSSFWRSTSGEESTPLEKSIEDAVTAFSGRGCPWLFLLRCEARRVECWFGASARVVGKDALTSMLSAAFPDARLDASPVLDKSTLPELRHAALVTGTPSAKWDLKQQATGDQIEKLIRGLLGTRWIYGVYSDPIAKVDVLRALNEISTEIHDVHATHLLKHSAIDEKNRTAERYVQLLESKLRRFEIGRATGMWSSQIFLMTADESALDLGRGLLHGAFSGEQSLPDPIRSGVCNGRVSGGPRIEPLTSQEVALFARPPREEYFGYEIVEYARFGAETGSVSPSGLRHIAVGDVFDRGANTGETLSITARDLTKHGLIVGVTGSGKTTTCMTLLDQLWDAGRGVPFLVIEPAKSEYRNLLDDRRFTGLRVFTAGDETVSPLRLNPFEVPEGSLVQTHIDYLKSLFAAAFVLYPPMPYVLEQSLQETYEDRGWDLARNINLRGHDSPRRFPTLGDLARKIAAVVDRMGYDERITMDVKAGLLARVNQLRIGGGKGLMFTARGSVPASALFDAPCVIELKQIVSDDEKAFLIGLILIRLSEHMEARARLAPADDLRHVTLIEEAHRLLRNTSTEQGSEVTANPRGRAIEVFANILSEIRAFGEGILIAEQVPSKLTPDAIKNTNLKVVHRLVAEDDRRLVGGTMNLSETQMRYLSVLLPGEAAAFTEGMRKSVLIHVSPASGAGLLRGTADGEVAGAMAAFRGSIPHLYLANTGCRTCPVREARPSSGCNPARTRAVEPRLVAAADRVVSAMRFDIAGVADAYADFESTLRRDPLSLKDGVSAYCVLVGIVESELEARADFHGWTYEQVDAVIDAACGALRAAIVPGGVPAATSEIERFSSLSERLHALEILPYPGCRFCARPCQYRFDVRSQGADVFNSDFRSAFSDTRISTEGLARICFDRTAAAFPRGAATIRKEAGFCFAVQQLSGLDLPPRKQEAMAKLLAQDLVQLRPPQGV